MGRRRGNMYEIEKKNTTWQYKLALRNVSMHNEWMDTYIYIYTHTNYIYNYYSGPNYDNLIQILIQTHTHIYTQTQTHNCKLVMLHDQLLRWLRSWVNRSYWLALDEDEEEEEVLCEYLSSEANKWLCIPLYTTFILVFLGSSEANHSTLFLAVQLLFRQLK